MKYSLMLILLTLLACQQKKNEKIIKIDLSSLKDEGKIEPCEYRKQNNYYQYFLNIVQKYIQGIKLTRDSDRKRCLDTATFRYEQYLALYDKLSLDSGWTITADYYGNEDAGAPVTSVQNKIDTTRIRLYRNWCSVGLVYDMLIPSPHRKNALDLSEQMIYAPVSKSYIPHMHVRDCREGYFQYALFHLLCDRLALFQHANYQQVTPILSDEAKEMCIKKWNLQKHLNSLSYNRLQTIHTVPTVTISADSCLVGFEYFNPWTGLSRCEMIISRKYPHCVRTQCDSTLVSYDCKIRY